MRLFFLTMACLALAACQTTSAGTRVTSAPVTSKPLQSTTIDEHGVRLAFDAFDTALTAVDGLIAAKIIVPGSPVALRLGRQLGIVKEALNAAASAQRAGNAETYASALADAKAAYASIQAMLREMKR